MLVAIQIMSISTNLDFVHLFLEVWFKLVQYLWQICSQSSNIFNQSRIMRLQSYSKEGVGRKQLYIIICFKIQNLEYVWMETWNLEEFSKKIQVNWLNLMDTKFGRSKFLVCILGCIDKEILEKNNKFRILLLFENPFSFCWTLVVTI